MVLAELLIAHILRPRAATNRSRLGKMCHPADAACRGGGHDLLQDCVPETAVGWAELVERLCRIPSAYD
jgi:hypothetical protein